MVVILMHANEYSMSGSAHDTYYRALDQLLSDRLGGAMPALVGYYGMMRVQLGLPEAGAGDAPHPRSRPFALLCLKSCEAAGGDWTRALGVAAAIELLANWFHLHDSIEDALRLSSEEDSSWKPWGMPQAINTGDGLFPMAAMAMLDATEDEALAMSLARGLTDVSIAHMRGRYRELDGLVQSPDDRRRVTESTAGTLGAFAASAGAALAGADEGTRQAMQSFGRAAGAVWILARAGESSADPLALAKAAIPTGLSDDTRDSLAAFVREIATSFETAASSAGEQPRP